MIWIKGIANWNGKEVVNDDKQWHSIEECDDSYLYIDGKKTYELIINSNEKFEVKEVNDNAK